MLDGTITIRKSVVAASGLALTALLTLSACAGLSGKATEPFRDAPVSFQNDQAAIEVLMPDGFSNFAYKCIKAGIGGAAAYHADQNRTAVALIADPTCK